jgi:hypothetical protein
MKSGRVIVALACAGLAIGCNGDDPTAPNGSVNNGGFGNQMLLVQGTVNVDEVTGGFLTEFRVNVWGRDGEPVTGADVTVEGNFAPISLQESVSEGSYSADLTGAASGTLRLTVDKDSMYVRDVVLGNIGIHAFVAPEAQDTVLANVPLIVRWVSDREAPFATLTTRDETFYNVADAGEYVVPDSLNPPRSNQRFELLRVNEVQIAGGLRGSYFRMEVLRKVEPVVVQEAQP